MMDPVDTSEIWRNYAIIAAGVAGVIIAIWRGRSANRQAKASLDQAAIARRRHETELFNTAVGQLGHEQLEIRLGAIFSFIEMSKSSAEFQHYAFELFSVYIKQRSAGVTSDIETAIDLNEANGFIRDCLKQNGHANSKITERCLDLEGAVIPGTDLSDANLFYANFKLANLSRGNLTKARLVDARMQGANFKGANLSGADLSGSKIDGADFSDSDLSNVNFSDVDLMSVNLGGANLRGADLGEARGVTWWKLFDATIDDATKLPGDLDLAGLFEHLQTVCNSVDWKAELESDPAIALSQLIATAGDRSVGKFLSEVRFTKFMAENDG